MLPLRGEQEQKRTRTGLSKTSAVPTLRQGSDVSINLLAVERIRAKAPALWGPSRHGLRRVPRPRVISRSAAYWHTSPGGAAVPQRGVL
ncbi:hypothetical protein GN956_G19985 [Arapaima gigas]